MPKNKYICKGWKDCKYSPYKLGSNVHHCCGFLTEHGFNSKLDHCNSIPMAEEIEFEIKLRLGL